MENLEQTQAEESTKALTPEELDKQTQDLAKVTEIRLKTLSQLIGIHIDSFSAIMINTNGVSYKEKLQAASALKEALLFPLDFGLNVTKADIREKGVKYAKEVNSLAGMMVQALDARFLLLANNMRNEQEKQNSTQNVEENKGEQNEQTTEQA